MTFDLTGKITCEEFVKGQLDLLEESSPPDLLEKLRTLRKNVRADLSPAGILRAIFTDVDTNNNGTVSRKELRSALGQSQGDLGDLFAWLDVALMDESSTEDGDGKPIPLKFSKKKGF